jgi:hypothetical protein
MSEPIFTPSKLYLSPEEVFDEVSSCLAIPLLGYSCSWLTDHLVKVLIFHIKLQLERNSVIFAQVVHCHTGRNALASSLWGKKEISS